MNIEEEFYIEIGLKITDNIEGQMFGKKCFKINKKAFCCFFEKAMVFKLNGEFHDEAMCLDATKLFDSSRKNRPMKEWVQIPYIYKDKWEYFAEKSADYVLNI